MDHQDHLRHTPTLLRFGVLAAAVVAISFNPPARAQNDGPKVTAESQFDSVEAIDEAFAADLLDLERKRLEQLKQLAGRLDGSRATDVYEIYFQSALQAGLYEEAEALAEGLLERGVTSPILRYLASISNIMAEARRGDFEESYRSLMVAVDAAATDPQRDTGLPERALPVTARLSLLDAYYQLLVRADQFSLALRAFRTIAETREESAEPAIAQYLANRIKQLEMIGEAAPSFSATDLDGNSVSLDDFEGSVVLLYFWATWHQPINDELSWIEEQYEARSDQGFRVIGINLDAIAGGGNAVDQVATEVREALIENNVRWPNIIDLPGPASIAQRYTVTEIPANVLVGRDGSIIQLDLTASNFDRIADEALQVD